LAEYLPYYLKRKDLIQKYRAEVKGFGSLEQANYYKRNIERLENYKESLRDMENATEFNFRVNASDEYCAHIINAIETGKPFLFNGNVVNKDGGLITNLPANCCVEVPTTADSQGLHPQGGISLPPVCQGLCMTNVMVQQCAVKGAIKRDKELIYQAVLLDPNTASVCSPVEIRKMVEEMFDAEEEWLPKF